MASIRAGYIDYEAVEKIAATLIRALRDANTQFGLDVNGAVRLMRHFGVDPEQVEGADLELLADMSGADGTKARSRGSIKMLGRGAYYARLPRIACSLVLATEATPNFPYSDGKAARRLLAHMGMDVDLEGDCDLDWIANDIGARTLDDAEHPAATPLLD